MATIMLVGSYFGDGIAGLLHCAERGSCEGTPREAKEGVNGPLSRRYSSEVDSVGEGSSGRLHVLYRLK